MIPLTVVEELDSLKTRPDDVGRAARTALRSLEERQALTSEWESLQEAAADGREGRPRRYYRLTSAGAEMARAELRSRRLAWNKGHLLPLPTSGEIR